MDHQLAKVHTLSRQGDWDQVLPLLRAQPALVNAATEPKGYTALHQAAWHGASLEVVGELLALGADRGLLTVNKRQTAAKIAQEKHPDRRDLVFLLGDSPRTMAQLMRKMLADDPTLFPHYDANRLVFDLVVEAFGADLFGNGDDCLDERLGAAFHAALGTPPVPGATFGVECGFVFDTQCESDLWTGRIAEVLRSVDEAIAAADAVIGKLRETRSHRLEALMALPGKFRRIDEICRLSGGYGFPIKHQGKASGRYPFAKVSDMNRPGNEVQMRHAENYVDEADLRTLKAKTFPVGTTFFPKVGATLLTNKRRIAAVEMLVDNNVMGAVATHVAPWFLYYAFCTIDMADYVQPGAVPSINQRTVGQIMVPVPDRAVQEEYVATMRDLESAIEAQSDALTQLMTAKLALRSDLLSGRVRVPA